MKTYLIEPRDPVMFRDARPFGAGSDKTYSLEFAWPSTIAGFVRSRAGRDASGRFDMSPDEARALRVRGPWLVEVDAAGPVHPYVPAPRDVVWFQEDAAHAAWTRRRLVPGAWGSGELSDLQGHGLAPIHFADEPTGNPGKPAAGPTFWRWDAMRAWLGAPTPVETFSPAERQALGVAGLPHERRTHVKIDERTGTADDGMLFSTDALRFAWKDGAGLRRFALACEADVGHRAGRMLEGTSTLGGERRTVYVRESGSALIPPPTWSASDVRHQGCRVVLATPAILEGGSIPGLGGADGGPKVYAACVGRPLSVSGWDVSANSPKPSRRVVPAGSVFWLRWPEGTPDASVAEWMNAQWMRSIGGTEQDQRDGFGLMMTGRW